MNVGMLVDLGFNRNEALVYLSLAKFGISDANKLINDTKLHRNLVYENLEKLINRGLVSYVVEKGRRVYKIADARMLVEAIEEQERHLSEQKMSASSIAEQINALARQSKQVQTAHIYRGVLGVKLFFTESLDGSDYVVFGAPQSSIDVMGEVFWKNHNRKRISKKIRARMIFNPSIKAYGDQQVNAYTHIRYFKQDVEPHTETHIQDDKVGIIVWSDEPVVFIIQDAVVAKNYLSFFEEMWKKAKP